MSIKLINWPKNVPEFCYRLTRGLLYAFTFVLCLLGLSMIFFSFWYIYEGKTYHLDNTVSFSIFSISLLVGIILFTLSSCGLYAILKENIRYSKIFLMGMMLLIVIEFGTIFLIYAYKRQIFLNANTIFENFISNYADDDDVRLLVDTIQSDLKCCGISSPNDWDQNPYYSCDSISSFACSVPPSCCYNFTMDKQSQFNLFCGIGIRRHDAVNQLYQMVHVKGCKYAIYTFLEYKYKITAGIFISLIIPQLLGVLLIIVYILILNYLIDMDLADLNFNLHYHHHSAAAIKSIGMNNEDGDEESATAAGSSSSGSESGRTTPASGARLILLQYRQATTNDELSSDSVEASPSPKPPKVHFFSEVVNKASLKQSRSGNSIGRY